MREAIKSAAPCAACWTECKFSNQLLNQLLRMNVFCREFVHEDVRTHSCTNPGGLCTIVQPSLPPAGTAHCAELTHGARNLVFCFAVFAFFFARRNFLKNRSLKKHFSFALFAPLGPPGVDFRRFLVPKRGPGAWIFSFFCEIAVFLKLHPLLGNNTIFRVQTSQNRPAECFRASMRQKIDKNR